MPLLNRRSPVDVCLKHDQISIIDYGLALNSIESTSPKPPGVRKGGTISFNFFSKSTVKLLHSIKQLNFRNKKKKKLNKATS